MSYMRKLNPDYFKEIVYSDTNRLAYLEYHDMQYSLSLPDYILAMIYINREKRNHKIRNKQAERDLYALMQADLDKQLDYIVKDRDAALRSVEKAAQETQDILANMIKE